MMTLKDAVQTPEGLRLVYEVSHQTPGREGTTVTSPLNLLISSTGKHTCEMHIGDCSDLNVDGALHRMSEWLRRLADGLDERKYITIPG